MVKQITVVRTGDLTRVSLVRVSTVDDSAVAGLDYRPRTEMLQFNQGVSALNFDVEIFPDNDKEPAESFRVVLGPQAPVAGVFGKILSATVFIQDTSLSTNNYSYLNGSDQAAVGDRRAFAAANMPYLNSLENFVSRNEEKTSQEAVSYAVNGESLICLQVSFIFTKIIFIFYYMQDSAPTVQKGLKDIFEVNQK